MHLIDHVDTEHILELSLRVDRNALIQRGERSKRKFHGLYGPEGYERTNQELRDVGSPVGATDAKHVTLSAGMCESRGE